MQRRDFLKLAARTIPAITAGTILSKSVQSCSGNLSQQPNIVMILVDDLGWADVEYNGSLFYETPNIDRLHAESMEFTNAYAACAVCSPTRASIMTGQYPARIGITDFIPVVRLRQQREQEADFLTQQVHQDEYVKNNGRPLLTPTNNYWLDLEKVTVAELLKNEGYATCHIGKWHLGDEPWYPDKQGFDQNIGGCDLGQPPSYFDPYHRNETFPNIPTLEPRNEGEYLVDRNADEAASFIREHSRQPFFLNMSHYAVHTPLQAKDELEDYYRNKQGIAQNNPTYAAMLQSVDESVGTIMDTLEQEGIVDQTIIIFTSDNGGLLRATSNAPLRSGKGFPYEGGIRVPLLIKWPGVTPPGSVDETPVISADFFPTICEILDIIPPEELVLDGVSLVPLLTESGSPDRPALFWHFPHYRYDDEVPYSVVRSGYWKLIKRYEGTTYELFNLGSDIGEQENLADQMPGKVQKLNEMLEFWLEHVDADLPKPNPEYTS